MRAGSRAMRCTPRCTRRTVAPAFATGPRATAIRARHRARGHERGDRALRVRPAARARGARAACARALWPAALRRSPGRLQRRRCVGVTQRAFLPGWLHGRAAEPHESRRPAVGLSGPRSGAYAGAAARSSSRAPRRRSPSTTRCASITRTAWCARGCIAADDPIRGTPSATARGLHESPDATRPRALRDRARRPARPHAAALRRSTGCARSIDEQVARYATLHRRDRRAPRTARTLSLRGAVDDADAARRVLARHGLGRWRVTQKANLDDPRDVYRTENVAREDWVMLGNHDTAPIFARDRGVVAGEAREVGASPGGAARLAHPAAPRERRLPRDRDARRAVRVARRERVRSSSPTCSATPSASTCPASSTTTNWTLRLPPDFAASMRIVSLRDARSICHSPSTSRYHPANAGPPTSR